MQRLLHHPLIHQGEVALKKIKPPAPQEEDKSISLLQRIHCIRKILKLAADQDSAPTNTSTKSSK